LTGKLWQFLAGNFDRFWREIRTDFGGKLEQILAGKLEQILAGN
jgi:hypothetical protein